MKRKAPTKKIGAEIISDLRSLRDALKNGEPIARKFTIRKVELDLQPQEYDAESVKRTRKKLNVSQAVFAQLLGAKVDLVQSWEQGLRSPNGMACRLLDLINQNREHWIRVIKASTKQDHAVV